MNIDEIKAKLPDVKVAVDGKVYIGQLTGRAMPFATVTIHHTVWGAHSMEYSWAAVKRAINNDTALKV